MREYDSTPDTVHTKEYLKELQSMPFWRKVQRTQALLIQWYQHYEGNVYISFSGGKDSTVLLDIARKLFPDIKAVFSNTGLEYPEVQSFVKSFDNVDIVRPKMSFPDVIRTYGYPLVSKETAEAIHFARRKIPKDVVNGTTPPRIEHAEGSKQNCLGREKIQSDHQGKAQAHGEKTEPG